MIRQMTVNDLHSVLAIARKTNLSWSLSQFESSLVYHDCFVYQVKEDVQGFCILSDLVDFYELLLIAVHPNQYGKGVAQVLMQHIDREMVDRGLSRLLLEVRASNQRAQRFYLKEGFVKTGVRKRYYALSQGQYEDAWIYEKVKD